MLEDRVLVWRAKRGSKQAFDQIYHRYLDYNQPFGPRTFDLAGEAPADVNRVDLTGIPMGIERGERTEQEIAHAVVTDFLEAWVAGDLDKAVLIHGYTDPCQATALRGQLQQLQAKRLISMGEPRVPDRPKRGQVVPCTLEIERQGRAVQVVYEFLVNEGSRGRWQIRELRQQK